ncbi:hypothetical protein ACIQZG_05615 [Lysinibacillus sp. NPDC096418]|uniref:hypothetical protein n=1 Tax=Lysinibacillus sp. NPDC096418 TaxID=3364138 RepID=UPI00380594E6
MKVELENLFSADETIQDKVIHVFKRYGIYLCAPVIRERALKTCFNPVVTLNEDVTYDKMAALYKSLKNELGINSIGERFYFAFSDKEYEEAPLFTLNSTGNSAEMFLDDRGTLFTKRTYCGECGLIEKEQRSPLVVDTSKIKDRYLLHTSGYWVASEKMVSIMEKGNIEGYELLEVIHQGDDVGKQPAYQIFPKEVLPSCCADRVKLHFATESPPCRCGLKGIINGPSLYAKKDLVELKGDVFLAAEWSHNGSHLYKKTIFSRKFRDLIIENNISQEVKGEKDKNFGPKDWLLEPVLLK